MSLKHFIGQICSVHDSGFGLWLFAQTQNFCYDFETVSCHPHHQRIRLFVEEVEYKGCVEIACLVRCSPACCLDCEGFQRFLAMAFEGFLHVIKNVFVFHRAK